MNLFQEKSMSMWEMGRVLTLEECAEKRGLVHGTCPGLVEGSEYIFRIKAVNIGTATYKRKTNKYFNQREEPQ